MGNSKHFHVNCGDFIVCIVFTPVHFISLCRFPFVCVSIGLTIGKIPTIGVVYNPIMDEVRIFMLRECIMFGTTIGGIDHTYMRRDVLPVLLKAIGVTNTCLTF